MNKKRSEESVVRSVRFRRDQWSAIEKRANELGIQAGTLVRNAALRVAGVPTEGDELREVADAIDRAIKQ